MQVASDSESKSLGMPSDVKASPAKSIGTLVVFSLVPRLIGLAIAFAIFEFGAKKDYEAKIELLNLYKLSPLYFGVVIFSVMVSWVNSAPMYFKDKCMTLDHGNLRANMMIYRVNQTDRSQDLPYVVLETEGGIGQYNRANRSLTHFTENAAGIMLTLLLAGFVYPNATLAFIIVFALGRIIHQVGYSGGYGKHAPGFVLALLATLTLEMLVLLAAIKSM